MFAYVGRNQNLKDLKDQWHEPGSLPVVYLVIQVGNWGTGNDDVGLIQSNKATKQLTRTDLKDLKDLKDRSAKKQVPVLPRSSVGPTGGLDVIRKEAWSFYRTISDVRLCWELEESKGPKGNLRLMSKSGRNRNPQLAEGVTFHRTKDLCRIGLASWLKRILNSLFTCQERNLKRSYGYQASAT